MIYELPKPKSPELFENMICDLVNYLFNTTSFSTYGRKGQKQNGIDIISYEKKMVVQCKLRTLNLTDRKTKITFINEIIKDINSILSQGRFPRKIIIATTLENDTLIQDQLNSWLLFHSTPIAIEFWSWDKISNDFFLFSNLVNKYYPFRNNNIELARMEVLNKSIYRRSKENEKLYEFQNIKGRNQLPVFDFSFINNTENTILLNSINCYCNMLAVARGGFPPKPTGILKPTKKLLINFKFNTFLDEQEEIKIDLANPIFITPKSPVRIQIQNKKPLINFYRINFKFNFNDTSIITPELFFNSDNAYSGRIIKEI